MNFFLKNYFYFNEGDVWLSKVVIKFSKLILELRETNKDCLVCGHMEDYVTNVNDLPYSILV